MIYIENNYENFEIQEEILHTIERAIEFALKEEEIDFDYEVSVTLVNNEEIRNINKDNRGIDKATDVLSFPCIEYEEGKVFKELYDINSFDDSYFDGDALVLGDIVLSLDKCKEQSEEYGHSFKRESAYLVIHSVLHLLGYDHMNEDDKRKMRKREEELLEELNIPRE
ncbi:rRNA maturation RNase YbeY [Oceanirhabdus sp. W0125-5]|uniref:rRNA maturation RNase YbeY n=1 Tax=Oceanirhabdus sp. W0125-5 TaxID=2999116 RepID=UPI0022F2EBEB|nr:rRNA maturation RNase YbeY [Oceanirhabdus sp. W0125-5]WBW95770.1 rRNA maturation RNase YbeY [Oceanirhabdus sp. W0125-5]